MNVLSLFDGISCGQLALKAAGISVSKYFASEIDKNAIKVTQHHFPNTVQLGDVTKVQGANLPKIDLLIGGSPCTGFSCSGKQLNFNDPQSKLFWEYVRLLKECSPRYFLLENVRMKKEYQDIISQHLGVSPVLVNSTTVGVQSRNRLYWTNIPYSPKTQDSPYVVKDILDQVYNNGVDPTKEEIEENLKRILKNSKYLNTFVWTYDYAGRVIVNRPDSYKIQRICPISFLNHKSGIIGCTDVPHIWDGREIRKVSPKEAERLQTLPDGYTEILKKPSPRYKAIGNGWTVSVIADIFKGIDTKS